MLKVAPNEDYVEVIDVHIDISESETIVSVGCEEPELYAMSTWTSMKACGWRQG